MNSTAVAIAGSNSDRRSFSTRVELKTAVGGITITSNVVAPKIKYVDIQFI